MYCYDGTAAKSYCVDNSIPYTLLNYKCGANLTWSLSNGTLTISGSGAMDDYASGVSSPFRERASAIKTVIIGSGVTSIGDRAFMQCAGITQIQFSSGSTLERIGGEAFSGCSGLTSLTLPGSLTSMGDSVFRDCANLQSVSIPNGVATIGIAIFTNCTSLASVTLPAGLRRIPNGMFTYCSSLTGITIPAAVETIGARAFTDCTALQTVTIPKGTATIMGNAFRRCGSLTRDIRLRVQRRLPLRQNEPSGFPRFYVRAGFRAARRASCH